MRKTSFAQLSSFYFFYFATLGAFIPYWSPYLKSQNFSAAEIGELIAIVMGSKIFSPYLLSWLSDHISRRLIIVQVSMVFASLIFAGVLPYQSYWWFVAVMAAFGFFWNASMPLFEVLTLNSLGDDINRYSHIRLWGSVGFIVLVVVLPYYIEGKNIERLPQFILGLLMATTATTLLVKDQPAKITNTQAAHIVTTLKSPIVIALLISCALQTLSHGAYYTFFSIYLEEHQYSREFAGWMWALGVFAEVILFMLMRPLLNYFSVYRLFSIALFITSIRWVILALWVDNLALLLFAQLLHAASFGLFHTTAIYLIHSLFPGRLQARGQALYAGMSFGLGGTMGHLLSGYSWQSLGSTWAFLSSAVIALIGAIIAAKYVTKEQLLVYPNET